MLEVYGHFRREASHAVSSLLQTSQKVNILPKDRTSVFSTKYKRKEKNKTGKGQTIGHFIHASMPALYSLHIF